MNSVVTTVKEKFAQVDDLKHLATDVLVRCQRAGASQAEVGVNHDRGINVNVRMGDVETIENTRDRSLSITVYFGKRKGSASTADFSSASIAATVDYACAIARYTEEDSASGLADPERLAHNFPDLDLWHPWNLSAEQAINLGIACEQAGRELDPRISNSDGASINSGEGVSVYANSHGFMGSERGTRHSISCALIAENDQGMQRDHAYSVARREQDLEKPEIVGQQAAQRTLQRLGARQLSTRQCAVLFSPEIARSLIGHFIAAVSGGALYRRSSFLLDHLGKRIFPQWFSLREEPHILRGHGSCVFDAEGVKTGDSDLVSEGILQRYVLGSYSARKLGLSSTANAGGIHNLSVGHGDQNLKTLLREMGTGLWVTDTMGQGVSIITGDYSRGASGFWVENGEIQFPVEEVTIAGNLRDMYAGIQAVGNDLDYRSQILTGSLWIDRMTVAGS
jgi:PmbA protein